MYKTVRKGDASLQYTILPQTDQFSSSGYPQAAGKPRPRIIKYTMATLMVLIILSCVATPFLMNQNDQSLFANTVLAMGRVSHNAIARNTSRGQGKDVAHKSKNRMPMTTTTSAMEAYRKQDVEDEMSTMSDPLEAEIQETADPTTTDNSMTSGGTQPRSHASSKTPTSVRQTSTSIVLPSTLSTMFSTTFKTVVNTPNEAIKASTGTPRLSKMPRITLKLRENETIPQMYMKAGIASYKKGNITTSVLAHGLSLEGLIFKTPEGTIKPWPQKWFFTDPSSDFQWKGSNQIPIMIYIVLAGLAALASISIVLMFYVQRKAIRRQRQNVVEPEAGGQEEDKSTLLGGDSQETEEKE